jgi:hypothetical protein
MCSVGVNAAWIAIGVYTLATRLPTMPGRHLEPHRR